MQDPYIQKNGTLINKLNIESYEELKKAEKDIVFAKLIDYKNIEQTDNKIQNLKNIHKHILGDVFDWAGEFRTVPIYKEEVVLPMLSLEYAAPNEIDKKIGMYFDNLKKVDWQNKNEDEKSLEFTKQMAQLWRIHPFRDGNTRTTVAFATLYSKEIGFELNICNMLDNLERKYDENGNISRFSLRDKFVLAALDEKDYPEPEHLNDVIKKSIVKENTKENTKEIEERQ